MLPIIRTIVYWGLYWGPLFWETTNLLVSVLGSPYSGQLPNHKARPYSKGFGLSVVFLGFRDFGPDNLELLYAR